MTIFVYALHISLPPIAYVFRNEFLKG